MIQNCLQTEPWHRRRSRLNHDWLKNTFIIQLGALKNLAAAKQEADSELMAACQRALREWNEHRLRAHNLIEAFGIEECPKALFLIPPLSHCDQETKSWLPDYIHRHWLAAHPVETWIQDAMNSWKEADKQAEILKSGLEQTPSNPDSLAIFVDDFRHSVSALSDAISNFPNRQLI